MTLTRCRIRIPLALLAAVVAGMFPLPAAAQRVNTAAVNPAPLRLTIDEAIERGLRANLQVLVAETHLEEAQATGQRARALLLPKVFGETSASLQNRSLRAFGISGPGIPTVVGPFSLFDFRFSVSQPLFDLSAYHLWKGSRRQEEAARLSYDDARSLIRRVVSRLYLTAQSAEARTDAALSRVKTAEALVKLARDRREVGVATGVDVLRAEVALTNGRQRLLEAENDSRQARLRLARAIGVSLSTPIELSETLTLVPAPALEPDAELAGALSRRADYLALAAQRRAALAEVKSVKSRRLPRVDVRANYGGLGRNLGEIDATGAIQGTISVPLFDRDRGGEIAQLEARLRRVEHQLADLRVGVEQDLREALLNLESAAAQVEVARHGEELAERELELSRARFETGVTNNIEVTNAQDALARAQENSILALARHADARSALERALGAGATLPVAPAVRDDVRGEDPGENTFEELEP